MILFFLMACDGSSDGPPPQVLEPCVEAECVNRLANATWYGPDYEAKVGDALASWGDLVLVGAPIYPLREYTPGPTFVQALALPSLAAGGAWIGKEHEFDLTGSSIDIDDIDADGVPEIAIGQPAGVPHPDVRGVTYLVTGLPTTDIDVSEAATLEFRSPRATRAGIGSRFGRVLDADRAHLITCGHGNSVTDTPGSVYAIDPQLRGVLGEEDATRILRGPFGFGQAIAAWDLDLDGQDDLIVTNAFTGVDWFLGPWVSAADEADRDGQWTVGPLTDGLDHILDPVGDVTGDGAPDLGFTSLTHEEPVSRAGRAYVVAAGDTAGGSIEDLAIQVHGRTLGEGMGSAIAGGDVDGDGQDDLIVGASGVYPGYGPGWVYLFRGPLGAGTLDSTVADARVRGENPQDFLGRSLAVVDADGDAQRDVVVGATGWPNDQYHGAVYLVHGVDWVP